MIVFKLKIHCPDKTSLNNFIEFIKHSKIVSVTDKSLPIKKSIVTFLKSPHVNKSSQRQVEYRAYQKRLRFKTNNPFKIYFFLKKINECLFFDITFSSLQIEFIKKNCFYNKQQQLTKTKAKLKELDLKGENILRTFNLKNKKSDEIRF